MTPAHYVTDYRKLVRNLLDTMPREQAMEAAVGGAFDAMGKIELEILEEYGKLRDDCSVVDVGCGSGRLTKALADSKYLIDGYLGTDVVPELVEYANLRFGCNPDYRFEVVTELTIPAVTTSRDIVCFFSVLTHLKPEEGYAYLKEAYRVLVPGGRCIVSYLTYGYHWDMFAECVSQAESGVTGDHLNTFLEPITLDLWANLIGFSKRIAVNKPELGQSAVCLVK